MVYLSNAPLKHKDDILLDGMGYTPWVLSSERPNQGQRSSRSQFAFNRNSLWLRNLVKRFLNRGGPVTRCWAQRSWWVIRNQPKVQLKRTSLSSVENQPMHWIGTSSRFVVTIFRKNHATSWNLICNFLNFSIKWGKNEKVNHLFNQNSGERTVVSWATARQCPVKTKYTVWC